MTTSTVPAPLPFGRLALSMLLIAMGLYGVNVDDAPGAPIMATVLMGLGIVIAVRAFRDRLSRSRARAAMALGIAVAAAMAYVSHDRVLTAPLAPAAADLATTVGVAPGPDGAAAVARARGLVREAAWAQRLPGVSVAVGRDGTIAWAEGFGWRDLATRTPVTPATRFAIGTATSLVLRAVASLDLPGTGSDEAGVWSPEHIGEPEEDFPGFRFLREVVFTPLGVVHPEPLPGDRATFYVPRVANDPRLGRRLMAMRDLACCADGRTFASTPSDVARVAMATRPADVDGQLAGGTVLSVVTGADGLVVVVASNIAHADTAALARAVADAFSSPTR
jgi:CubicO group peptidase (beta-lactamase class C family)